jgi:type IV pilus assembly protein PilY1
MVYFGTGRYLTGSDPSNIAVQSFYSIWDKNDATATVTRSQLQSQAITAETTEKGFGQRETSNNTVDWGTQRGWYLDLVPPSGNAAGERVISRALVKHDRIIFVTVIPSSDPCVAGGDSWLMELDTLTGGRTGTSAFDFGGPDGTPDDKFDDYDKLASGNVSSGVKSTVGIIGTPTWLKSETPGVAFKELSGTSGDIMSLKNREPDGGGGGTIERKYWMQVF